MGQLCQKHLIDKTATFAGPNAMSGLPGRSLLWILYRKPLAYRDFLSLISGFELAVGILRIRSETSLLLDLKVNLSPLIIITLSETFNIAMVISEIKILLGKTKIYRLENNDSADS